MEKLEKEIESQFVMLPKFEDLIPEHSKYFDEIVKEWNTYVNQAKAKKPIGHPAFQRLKTHKLVSLLPFYFEIRI